MSGDKRLPCPGSPALHQSSESLLSCTLGGLLWFVLIHRNCPPVPIPSCQCGPGKGSANTGHSEVTLCHPHRPGGSRASACLHPFFRFLPSHVCLQQWYCGLSRQRPHCHPCQPARDHDRDVSTGQGRCWDIPSASSSRLWLPQKELE